jgi:prepilin-type N-terminal cleavage/methylation domain-containing protein
VTGDRQQGFTLIEVIMVVSILGLLAGVLAAALRVGVHSGGQAMDQLDLSHDAEVLSLVLGDDLANASTVDTAAASCVAAPMIRLDVGAEIAYRIVGHRLVRVDCASGSERTIVRRLGDTAPTVTCTPACGPSATRVRVDVPVCARHPETDTCRITRAIRVIGRPRAA